MAMFLVKDRGVSALPTSTVVGAVFVGKGSLVLECGDDPLRVGKLGGKM
jgi:hypothetical protein